VKVTNKCKILASANIKEMRDAKHEELEEELAIHIRQLNVRNATTTYEVMNVSTVHYYFIKYSDDVFSFCN
jgi:hypothetical protein